MGPPLGASRRALRWSRPAPLSVRAARRLRGDIVEVPSHLVAQSFHDLLERRLSTGFAFGVVQDTPEWVVSPVLTLFSGRHFMHVRRALALTLAVPVLLAGCSDDPEPTPKIPEPTSSSPTPTETATEEPEAESPEEFIRRWVNENRQMFVTGQTDAFMAMGPNCDDCKKIADSVDRIYNAGGSVEWDGWEILELERRGRPSGNAFRFVVESAPTRYRESPTAPWQTLDGGRGVQLIVLEPADGSWHVIESKELPK